MLTNASSPATADKKHDEASVPRRYIVRFQQDKYTAFQHLMEYCFNSMDLWKNVAYSLSSFNVSSIL